MAAWQVTLRDPVWHVTRSGDACLQTAIVRLLYCTLSFSCKQISELAAKCDSGFNITHVGALADDKSFPLRISYGKIDSSVTVLYCISRAFARRNKCIGRRREGKKRTPAASRHRSLIVTLEKEMEQTDRQTYDVDQTVAVDASSAHK